MSCKSKKYACIVSVLWASWGITPAKCHAQTALQRAELLFAEGLELEHQNRPVEALEKFEQSQRLAPDSRTRIHIAYCQERMGIFDKAWRNFFQVERAASAKGSEATAEDMRSRKAALEGKLCKLRIILNSHVTPSVSITLDNEVLSPLDWTEETRVLPGRHELRWLEAGHLVMERSFHRGAAPGCEGQAQLNFGRSASAFTPRVALTSTSYAGLFLGLGGLGGILGFGTIGLVEHLKLQDFRKEILDKNPSEPWLCHATSPKDTVLSGQCDELISASKWAQGMAGLTLVSAGVSVLGFVILASSLTKEKPKAADGLRIDFIGASVSAPQTWGMGIHGHF